MNAPALVAGARVVARSRSYTIRAVAGGRVYVWATGHASAWFWAERLTWDPIDVSWRADVAPVDGVPGQAPAWPELEQ